MAILNVIDCKGGTCTMAIRKVTDCKGPVLWL